MFLNTASYLFTHPPFFASALLIMPPRPIRNSGLWGNEQSGPRRSTRRQYAPQRSDAWELRCMENEVQMLQDEADALSSVLTLLQSDTREMMAVNNELRQRLRAMQQQNQVQDVLKEELAEEIRQMKVALDLDLDAIIPLVQRRQQQCEDRANGAATSSGATGPAA